MNHIDKAHLSQFAYQTLYAGKFSNLAFFFVKVSRFFSNEGLALLTWEKQY